MTLAGRVRYRARCSSRDLWWASQATEAFIGMLRVFDEPAVVGETAQYTGESGADLEAASTIHQMNERTRANQPALPHAPVSEDLRRERLGHGARDDE
jgi:hypothetical protein